MRKLLFKFEVPGYQGHMVVGLYSTLRLLEQCPSSTLASKLVKLTYHIDSQTWGAHQKNAGILQPCEF